MVKGATQCLIYVTKKNNVLLRAMNVPQTIFLGAYAQKQRKGSQTSEYDSHENALCIMNITIDCALPHWLVSKQCNHVPLPTYVLENII